MRTIRVVSPGQSYRRCASSATLYVRCLQCLPQAHTPSIAFRHHSSKKEGCHKLVLGVCLKWCSGQLFFFFFFFFFLGGGGGWGARGTVSCSALLHVQLSWGLWPLRSEAGRFHMLLSICCCYEEPDIQSRFVVRQGQTCSTDPGWNQDRTLDLSCAKR